MIELREKIMEEQQNDVVNELKKKFAQRNAQSSQGQQSKPPQPAQRQRRTLPPTPPMTTTTTTTTTTTSSQNQTEFQMAYKAFCNDQENGILKQKFQAEFFKINKGLIESVKNAVSDFIRNPQNNSYKKKLETSLYEVAVK